jgi:hypothetical protein
MSKSMLVYLSILISQLRHNTLLRGDVLVAGAECQGGGERQGGRSAKGRWNPLGATERLGATTVTSWSGQTRGGWAMVTAQGPLVDGGWYEGWLVDCASTGSPRFVEEDDVRFLCEARGGWAIVPTQGPLGNKCSKWFRVFLLQPPSRSDPECRFTVSVSNTFIQIFV